MTSSCLYDIDVLQYKYVPWFCQSDRLSQDKIYVPNTTLANVCHVEDYKNKFIFDLTFVACVCVSID
jgi:hypothetical protein